MLSGVCGPLFLPGLLTDYSIRSFYEAGNLAGLERMKVKRKGLGSLRNRQLELLNAPFIPFIQWDIAATKGEVLIIFGSKLVSPCFVFDFYFINSSVNYSPWLKFIKTPSPGAAEAGGS